MGGNGISESDVTAGTRKIRVGEQQAKEAGRGDT